jgi:pimeloyl-ACP methyl ester carboxylesterase
VVTDPAFSGRRALLIDLPGFGYSDKPDSFGYGTAEQARVVVEVLDSLQLTRCSLFGHSMGGSIAIEAAELLGHRVQALLVSEPNLYAGGGMYSRAIAAQPEAGFIARGFADLLAAKRLPGRVCKTAPPGPYGEASSLVDGVSPSWFARFQQLSCRKALIYGELSLPAQEADDVVAAVFRCW